MQVTTRGASRPGQKNLRPRPAAPACSPTAGRADARPGPWHSAPVCSPTVRLRSDSAAPVCSPTAGRAEARPGPFTGDGGYAATRALLRAGGPEKSGPSSGTGRSPPAFEEWRAAEPQDMLSEQCERSIEKSFAQDILPPTGKGFGERSTAPQKSARQRRGGCNPPEGAFAWGSVAPPCAAGQLGRGSTKPSPPLVYPTAPDSPKRLVAQTGKTMNTGNTMNTEQYAQYVQYAQYSQHSQYSRQRRPTCPP